MPLEIIREAVKVRQTIGEDSVQTIAENDIIVPDAKPDIARILLIDGDIHIIEEEVLQDRVHINGIIRYKILYVSDELEQGIKSINTNTGFTYNLDICDARNGMKCKTRCDVEHIDYNVLNGRKINIKSIVRVNGKVFNELEHEIACDLKGREDIQVLKDRIGMNCFIGDSKADYTIRESLDIPASKPAIREIIRNDVKISGKDYKITDNKIIAKGALNIATLYIGDGEIQSIQSMEHEIPFTQFVDLAGIDEDSVCDVEYRVTDSQFEPEEDGDGELRILKSDVVLGISVCGFKKRFVEIISDTYSPQARISLDTIPFRAEDVMEDNKSRIIIKDSVITRNDSPDIAEVFNVLCKPVLSDFKVFDDKVVIEGAVNNNILYIANNAEHPVFCLQHEIPFRHSIDIKDIKADMGCEITLDIEHCNYSMISSNEVEIRLVIEVDAKVIRHVEFPMIMKVNEYPVENKKTKTQPGIIIYFVQPDDTIWKIAKKYLAKISDIQKANCLAENDVISEGQKIFICK